jgi:hypothetical protein
MRFNRQHKLLFLDPGHDAVCGDEKVDIILSPSLYWIKKISLPLNSLREVRTLLPSIFEDMLPEGIYSYSVYKNSEDSLFYAFAYEDKKILDVIAQHNIPLTNIASVHFAQSELNTLEHAVKINDEQCLYVKDSIVMLVPSSWVKEKEELDLSNIALSKHRITLQQFAHIVDYKSLYGVISVLLVLILLGFSELFITTQRSQEVAAKTDEIFVQNDLKPTMFENTSILKRYEKTHEIQTRLREYISYLLALKLNKGEKIALLSLKNKTILVNFSGVDQKKITHITSALTSKGVTYTQKYQDGTLHLEIKL